MNQTGGARPRFSGPNQATLPAEGSSQNTLLWRSRKQDGGDGDWEPSGSLWRVVPVRYWYGGVRLGSVQPRDITPSSAFRRQLAESWNPGP
jgi:hypothetical protein